MPPTCWPIGSLAQVEAKRLSKLGEAFARREALKAILAAKLPLGRALEAYEAAKHDALRAALRHALRQPCCAMLPPTMSDGDRGGGRGGSHGLVALGQAPRRAEQLQSVCEEVAHAVALSRLTVQMVTSEMSASHVANLLQRASAASERLLLLLPSMQLDALVAHRPDGPSMWHDFGFVIEYDPLPDVLQLGALSHSHLCVVSLRPSDSPAALHDDAPATASNAAATGTTGTIGTAAGTGTGTGTGTIDTTAGTGTAAASFGGGGQPLASSGTVSAPTAPESALMQMARSLREAHGREYDDVLDVTAMVQRVEATGGGGGGGSRSAERQQLPRSGSGAGSLPRVVMVGDDLLRYPRVQALLQRQGIALVETSVDVPHLILDHESGVLVLDAALLRRPAEALQMVAQCEPAYRSLWLLALWDDGGTKRGGVSAAAGAGDAADAAAARTARARVSAEAHSLVQQLLVRLSASPLKLSARVTRWSSCWPTLQHILRQRAADPLGGLATSEAAAAADDQREETQHEALLSLCGLNPWAARRVSQHYSLRDLLSLPPRLRLSHFGWVPERALRTLAFVVDGGSAERIDDEIASVLLPQQRHHLQHTRPPSEPPPPQRPRQQQQHQPQPQQPEQWQPEPDPWQLQSEQWPPPYACDEGGEDGPGMLDGGGSGGAVATLHASLDVYGGLGGSAYERAYHDDGAHGGGYHADGDGGGVSGGGGGDGGGGGGGGGGGHSLGLSRQADEYGQRKLSWRAGEPGPSTSEPHTEEWQPREESAFAAAAFAAAWAAPPPRAAKAGGGRAKAAGGRGRARAAAGGRGGGGAARGKRAKQQAE